MDKAQQFIAMVQTVFLANAVNRALGPNALDRRAEFSASGALIFMNEALDAATKIPANMSPAEAAESFAGWMLQSLREPGDRVPSWFAR
jgi:hypothetical protein